jgi:hypothetical protein
MNIIQNEFHWLLKGTNNILKSVMKLRYFMNLKRVYTENINEMFEI